MVRVGLLFLWCFIFFFFYVLPGFQEWKLITRQSVQLEESMRVKKERSLECYFKSLEGEFWTIVTGQGDHEIKLELYDEGRAINRIQSVLQTIDRKLLSFDLYYVESVAFIILYFEVDQ